ncbi:MAG: anti-sigma factor [Saprospiraceae bacterium]|nr:anti-sigma factor [Lewinella sp.]
MNIEEYISSGKLEQYLLGLLTDGEAREVEQIVQAYPEVRAELNAMEDALTQYAIAQGIPMPKELPDRIVKRLEVMGKDTGTPPPATAGTGGKGGNSWGLVLGLILAGAIVGLLLLWSKNNRLQEDSNRIQAQLQEVQDSCTVIQNNLTQTAIQLAILRSEGNQTYIMRGTDQNPGAVANVYYNPQDRRAFLDVRELPPPPAGQQYQLWGINSSGPISMDVFNLPPADTVQFIEVPFLDDVSTFAVSLEPQGGSPSPTVVHLISG